MDFLGFCMLASIYIFVGTASASARTKLEDVFYSLLGFFTSLGVFFGLWQLYHSIPDLLWAAGAMALGFILGYHSKKH